MYPVGGMMQASSIHIDFFPGLKRRDADQKKSLADLVDEGDSSYIVKDPSENEAFLPFGSGVRACLGEKIAILEISTLIASLLEHYEVRLQTGSESNPNSMGNNCVPRLLPNPKIIFLKRQK
ncbi:11-oxo-beta-amyrin 30-oxidase-like isoform X2 [Olea europaea subsp. europaea]|uniref:11-oxo-beta-amyrin 30-oxidase-like isoform X2 n=1 Tax=Olea europaea subsp. europaea TaxID=158383 RepID=A0A8S0QVV5_OLEEU|nr:11-oxo-beta-amyrin 30-oxidase-like isoform X2 [Olea europaea subsp. europaea]